MDLQGRRIVWASETNEDAKLDAAQVKYLTGGGSIKTRPLYGSMVEFKQTHLMLLMTNHKPQAPADDQAVWDRVALIPFEWRFVDKPQKNNERKRNRDLKNELLKEASGILAWLVHGCLEWQRGGLDMPERVRLATEDYRHEEDTIGQFVDQYCEEGEGLKVGAEQLYEAYKHWADTMSVYGDKRLDGIKFGKKMAQRYTRKRTNKGHVYHGIGLAVEIKPLGV